MLPEEVEGSLLYAVEFNKRPRTFLLLTVAQQVRENEVGTVGQLYTGPLNGRGEFIKHLLLELRRKQKNPAAARIMK
jgi:hypothetical protein